MWCDGTTTSTLLAHAILTDGVRNVAAGASAVDLEGGLVARSQGGGGGHPQPFLARSRNA